MPSLYDFNEFRERLASWCTLLDDQEVPSSHKLPNSGQRSISDVDEFFKTAKVHKVARNRDVAYMGAYWEAFGDSMDVRGEQLANTDWIQFDKAVMANLLLHELLQRNGFSARVTLKGRRRLVEMGFGHAR